MRLFQNKLKSLNDNNQTVDQWHQQDETTDGITNSDECTKSISIELYNLDCRRGLSIKWPRLIGLINFRRLQWWKEEICTSEKAIVFNLKLYRLYNKIVSCF